jgi:hypothetical protein
MLLPSWPLALEAFAAARMRLPWARSASAPAPDLPWACLPAFWLARPAAAWPAWPPASPEALGAAPRPSRPSSSRQISISSSSTGSSMLAACSPGLALAGASRTALGSAAAAAALAAASPASCPAVGRSSRSAYDGEGIKEWARLAKGIHID